MVVFGLLAGLIVLISGCEQPGTPLADRTGHIIVKLVEMPDNPPSEPKTDHINGHTLYFFVQLSDGPPYPMVGRGSFVVTNGTGTAGATGPDGGGTKNFEIGSYDLGAIIDMNDNGSIDTGDLQAGGDVSVIESQDGILIIGKKDFFSVPAGDDVGTVLGLEY